jgi:glycosyltransferase involved in cell wall biosynthesis
MLSCSERRLPRILWLTKGLGRGGAERLLVSAASRLDRSSFDLEVAYVLPWKNAFVPDLERLGVPVHCLGDPRALDPRWLARLHALVRRRRFDLVHTHMPLVAVGARTLPSRRVRIVHTEHNIWQRYRLVTRWANRLTYSRNSAVIAVSDAVAASIGRAPFVRAPDVCVIRHGPDLPAYGVTPDSRRRARAALPIAQDALVVGAVGNFTAKKDHRTMLEATAQVAAFNPTLQLVLVGSGPLESTLRDATASLGLTDRVLFAGSRDDIEDLLPAFDVFALSSRHEGLPIALVEAMAAGIPCVATSVGGVPELITDGNEGLLVPPGDAASFADGLRTLLGDERLRHSCGNRASQSARRFDIAQAVRGVEAVYREVLGCPRDDATQPIGYRSSPRNVR